MYKVARPRAAPHSGSPLLHEVAFTTFDLQMGTPDQRFDAHDYPIVMSVLPCKRRGSTARDSQRIQSSEGPCRLVSSDVCLNGLWTPAAASSRSVFTRTGVACVMPLSYQSCCQSCNRCGSATKSRQWISPHTLFLPLQASPS